LFVRFTNMSQDKEDSLPPSLSESDWKKILYSIEQSRNIKVPKCVPIIGEEAATPWIPSSRDIARRWAKEYEFPLEEDYYSSSQLSRVAQFLVLQEDEEKESPKEILRKELEDIVPPDFSLQQFADTSYSILADLNLPVYITTNYDLFMEDALKAKGKKPVSDFCRWNDVLKTPLQRATGIQDLGLGKKYIPKPENPLVYHLYGLYCLKPEYRRGDIDTEIPLANSLVLTEEDYINFALSLNTEAIEDLLPPIISMSFSSSSLLFIGYNLDDIGFRIILQGLLKSPPAVERTSLAVQLAPGGNPKRAIEYLSKYTKRMFHTRVYWGDPSNFCKELRREWENFKRKKA
jgi:hypothetical protein